MRKAFIQLHVAVFLAGFTAILGKLIGLNEGMLVWYRLAITVLTLIALLFFTKQLKRLPIKDAVQIGAVGVIVAVHWVFFYGSIKYANVSIGLICLSASGFFTSFFEPVIFKRPIRAAEVLLGIMAIAGIYIIFDFHPQYKLGIAFGILSAICSALFPIFNKKLVTKFEPGILTLYELGGGLLALTVLIPFYIRLFPAGYYIPTAGDWMWLLVLAWVCTVFCFYLQLNSLKKISPFTATLTYNLEPVYGIVLAFIFFGENKSLNVHFYAGVTLIFAAVVLQTFRLWYVNSRLPAF